MVTEKSEMSPKKEINASAISESMLLATGDRVLMQTALVKVQNVEGTRNAQIRLLMDSGSGQAYITNNIYQSD